MSDKKMTLRQILVELHDLRLADNTKPLMCAALDVVADRLDALEAQRKSIQPGFYWSMSTFSNPLTVVANPALLISTAAHADAEYDAAIARAEKAEKDRSVVEALYHNLVKAVRLLTPVKSFVLSNEVRVVNTGAFNELQELAK